ncbi:MAG TPA: hypothetical protein ENJ54_06850 [Chloroflexi bacterium]|nr:hypothetical protein [Chloroflexota bacterium]
MTTLTALTQLLIQPPGSFAYHLVLLFAIGGTLQAAWIQWQRTAYPQTRRLLTGLLLLLGVRLAYFAVGGLAWQNVLAPHLVIPIADRAAGAFSLVLFAWLWGFPERHRTGDALLLGGIGTVVLGVVASVIIWPYFSARYFNGSVVDLGWSGFNIMLGLGGFLLLVERRPNGATAGKIALGILTLGYTIHALLPPPSGDLDGYLRLAEIVAYPLLFSLPYRFAAPLRREVRPIQVQQATAPPPDRAAQEALLELLGTPPDDAEACPRIAKTVALLMKADLCLVVTPPRNERLSIACAYDLIREQALSGTSFPAQQAPILVAAMTRRRPLRLPASSTSADARTLTALLSLNRSGPLLAAPLDGGPDHPVQGSVVLLSAYAQHSWTAVEQERLAAIARHIGRWLITHTPAPPPSSAEPQAEPSAEITARLAALEEQVLALTEENDALRAQASEAALLQDRLKALAAAHEETQQVLDALEAENRRLQAALETSATKEQMTEEYHQNLKVLLSSAQDLRQPLASLMGYADLLLGESVGILGALQRQFVERIRASAARMAQAVDDMVQALSLETGGLEINPQEIDLNEAIDNALSRNSGLLREKRLLLRVDLPETLPPARLDREMFHHILHHLLRNAALASPEESEIQLRLKIMEEEGERLLMLEVTDSGGGVAPEDLPHVFSRRYRTTYRTIDGLGDSGLGMPLVKALVEALHGRIWAESTAGQGTTFTVLLPLPPVAQPAPAVAAPSEASKTP